MSGIEYRFLANIYELIHREINNAKSYLLLEC